MLLWWGQCCDLCPGFPGCPLPSGVQRWSHVRTGRHKVGGGSDGEQPASSFRAALLDPRPLPDRALLPAPLPPEAAPPLRTPPPPPDPPVAPRCFLWSWLVQPAAARGPREAQDSFECGPTQTHKRSEIFLRAHVAQDSPSSVAQGSPKVGHPWSKASRAPEGGAQTWEGLRTGAERRSLRPLLASYGLMMSAHWAARDPSPTCWGTTAVFHPSVNPTYNLQPPPPRTPCTGHPCTDRTGPSSPMRLSENQSHLSPAPTTGVPRLYKAPVTPSSSLPSWGLSDVIAISNSGSRPHFEN